jgi:hypothetical protein
MEFLPQALKHDRTGVVDAKYYEPFNAQGQPYEGSITSGINS